MSVLNNPATRVSASLVLGTVFITFILILIPPIVMPDGFATGLSWLLTELYKWDFLIPVSALISSLGLIILVDFILILFKVAMFIKDVMIKGSP